MPHWPHPEGDPRKREANTYAKNHQKNSKPKYYSDILAESSSSAEVELPKVKEKTYLERVKVQRDELHARKLAEKRAKVEAEQKAEEEETKLQENIKHTQSYFSNVTNVPRPSGSSIPIIDGALADEFTGAVKFEDHERVDGYFELTPTAFPEYEHRNLKKPAPTPRIVPQYLAEERANMQAGSVNKKAMFKEETETIPKPKYEEKKENYKETLLKPEKKKGEGTEEREKTPGELLTKTPAVSRDVKRKRIESWLEDIPEKRQKKYSWHEGDREGDEGYYEG